MKHSVVILLIVVCAGLMSCQKDPPVLTAAQLLIEKTWYLEKRVTPSRTFNYLGLTTYWFRLASDTSYKDSDGLSGFFSIDEKASPVKLNFILQGRVLERYSIQHMSFDYLVVEYFLNNARYTLYFSTRL